MSEEVTVTADPDVAEACRSASSQELRKLDLLVNFSLREATYGTRLLQEVMLEVGKNAREGELTPEILLSSFMKSESLRL
jgi:hypothetical protein